MIISFGTIVMIIYSNSNSFKQDEEKKETLDIFKGNEELGRIIGLCFCIIFSVSNGAIAVLHRKMHSLHVTVILFYFSLTGVILMTIVIPIKLSVSGKSFELFNYSGMQYLSIIVSGVCFMLAISTKVIA